MSYLKEIEELQEKRWRDAQEKSQQFFDIYFTPSEVTQAINPSLNPSVGNSFTDPLYEQIPQLQDKLALNPEPKTRSCPNCGRLGMYNATICGFCWTKTPIKEQQAASPFIW